MSWPLHFELGSTVLNLPSAWQCRCIFSLFLKKNQNQTTRLGRPKATKPQFWQVIIKLMFWDTVILGQQSLWSSLLLLPDLWWPKARSFCLATCHEGLQTEWWPQKNLFTITGFADLLHGTGQSSGVSGLQKSCWQSVEAKCTSQQQTQQVGQTLSD